MNCLDCEVPFAVNQPMMEVENGYICEGCMVHRRRKARKSAQHRMKTIIYCEVDALPPWITEEGFYVVDEKTKSVEGPFENEQAAQ
jgi:hypothetical protein